jgi:alpha-glucosidase (family GH31 glycosyl hydrolase)
MRSLVMNYPDDPRVWALGQQFLWGDDLLVAPVTREGATAWPVYLPAGAWYDFWTGARHLGPGGITVEAPLDRLPLLVRAGAILPMGPVVLHTRERPLDEVTLRIYPEGTARFELYEDDGRTNAYRRGEYALTAFECATDGGAVTVRIGAGVGDRSVVPAGRRYRLELRMDSPSTVTADGVGTLPRRAGLDEGGAGWWADARGFVGVRLPDLGGAPVTVTLRT